MIPPVGVGLRDRTAHLATPARPADPGTLVSMTEVTVATYEYRDEAEIALAQLSSVGIRGRVVADDEGGLNPGFFADYAVRLTVMAQDEAAARVALEDVAPS